MWGWGMSVIRRNGREYEWKPTRSAPSTPSALPELKDVLERTDLERAQIGLDYGAGYGRNARVLGAFCERLILVELPRNAEKLKDRVRRDGLDNCTIVVARDFAAHANSFDAIFFIYLLHTLPSHRMRKDLLQQAKSWLKDDGRLIVVVPGRDSKYRNNTLKNAVDLNDGSATLYDNGDFTFYKSFTPDELEALLRDSGFTIENVIGGDHKYIRVVSPSEG